VLEATYQWGSTAEAGILSVPDAGGLDLRTYDPDRSLDPLSTSSPYFGSIRPGTPVRLTGKVPSSIAAWTGFLDEARHELGSSIGRLRAIDGIALLAQAELAEGVSLPNTLRARVRAIVSAVGLSAIVPVQPEVPLGQYVVDGSFEEVSNPGVNAGIPLRWSFYPDASGCSVSFDGGSGNVVAGDRRLDIYDPATVGHYAYQIASNLQPGRSYDVAVWATCGGSARKIEIVDPDAGYANLLTLNVGSGPMVLKQGVFIAPDGGRVQMLLGTGAVTAGSWFNADVMSIVGPAGDALAADPPVAGHDGKARAAWSVIQDAALDALTYVWLGPTGTLRFTPWGSLADASYAVGCDDGTGGAWLAGLSELETIAQADSIRNSVRTWSSPSTFGPAVTDPVSIRKYGERRLDVARQVPSSSTWSARILADRADSGLEVTIGELRPYTAAELALLLSGAIDGPAALRIRDDDHGELVDLTVAIIGGSVGVTANGWRFQQVSMIPRAEWDEAEPPPIQPPIPPPATYHTETRSYIATSDALLALTSGGSKYGAGAASTLPVGAWSGWTYRSLLAFPAIPFGGLRRILSATLRLRTSTAVRVGFGSSPTIELHRITGAWSAGSSSSPSGSNAVVWPGPAVASTAVRSNLTTSQDTAVAIGGILPLVLPWAPTSLGGTLAPQRGLALYPGSGSGADTSELWPVERGGTSRPQLDLVVEVFD
jgi:hypothetical protein